MEQLIKLLKLKLADMIAEEIIAYEQRKIEQLKNN